MSKMSVELRPWLPRGGRPRTEENSDVVDIVASETLWQVPTFENAGQYALRLMTEMFYEVKMDQVII